MERSEQIDQLATALSKFQGSLEQPKLNSTVKVKTRTGGEYSFKYADLSECKAAAKKPLSENGLAVTQLIEDDYSLLTVLMHSSGQWISSRVKMPISEPGAQAIGSAITYAKRYAFCAILGIVADDDEDGNLSQGNTAQKQNRQNAPAKQPAKQQTAPKQQAPTKRMFDLKLCERDDFFPKIHEYEEKAQKEGKPFSVRSFLESVYQIDESALHHVEDRYSEYKTNNNIR